MTTSSSIVFDHLQTTYETDCTVGVAVVYFNYKEGNSQSLENIVSEMTHQLVCQSSTVPPALTIAYRKSQRTSTQIGLGEHKALLKATINSFDKVYLVVDAIDEFRDEEATTDFIELIRDFPSHAALLVTSRKIPVAKINPKGVNCNLLLVQRLTACADLRVFERVRAWGRRRCGGKIILSTCKTRPTESYLHHWYGATSVDPRHTFS